MSTVTGQVQEIVTKWNEKFQKNFIDIRVNGKAYGVGNFPPRDVAQGDTVTFESDDGQWPKVVRGSLRKVSGGAPSQGAPTSAATTPYVAPAKSGGYDDRQAVISKQAALNTAIAFAKLAIDAGTVNLGTTKQAQLAIVEAIVFEYAAKFHLFSTGEAVEVPEPEVKAKKAAAPATAAAKAKAIAPVSEDEWQDDDVEDIV